MNSIVTSVSQHTRPLSSQVCNKCGLYEKAHKKPRPLNDRGEFVRPGKHATKPSMGRGRARMRIISDQSAALGVAVMRFEEHAQ